MEILSVKEYQDKVSLDLPNVNDLVSISIEDVGASTFFQGIRESFEYGQRIEKAWFSLTMPAVAKYFLENGRNKHLLVYSQAFVNGRESTLEEIDYDYNQYGGQAEFAPPKIVNVVFKTVGFEGELGDNKLLLERLNLLEKPKFDLEGRLPSGVVLLKSSGELSAYGHNREEHIFLTEIERPYGVVTKNGDAIGVNSSAGGFDDFTKLFLE